MKEVVRNYGVLFITRGVITPIEFGGTKVPAGEIIAVSPYLTHHDPAVYEDPDTFKPERFSGNAIAKHIENKTYTQFGYGTHRCMGERFANIVMKVAWMELLTKYRVELLTPMTPPDFSRYKYDILFISLPNYHLFQSYWCSFLYWLDPLSFNENKGHAILKAVRLRTKIIYICKYFKI